MSGTAALPTSVNCRLTAREGGVRTERSPELRSFFAQEFEGDAPGFAVGGPEPRRAGFYVRRSAGSDDSARRCFVE